MGFSLKLFFRDLEWLINNDDIDDKEKLRDLIREIKDGKEYAEECNQLT